MKKLNTLFLLMFLGTFLLNGCGGGEKQADSEEETSEIERDAEERASPLMTAEGSIGNKTISLQYGAPSINERTIWGDLVPYEEVWRTGANEATYLNFSEDVMVEGEELAAGKYSLFTIPREEGDWTIIFNSEWNLEHGHYQYKEENDVLRVDVTPVWEENSQEQLSIDVESPGIVIRWEKVKLPITIE